MLVLSILLSTSKILNPKTTPAVTFPERAAFSDAFQAAVQSQLTLYYASAAPNDVKDVLLHGTFSHYGNIVRCHTHLSKLYRTAYIIYKSVVAIQNFDSTWGILCGKHCLHICLTTFSPDQCAERRAHVALLASLPRSTIAMDLAEIAEEVSAKSINIPFSMNSYNPKPYTYCHFTSKAAMENAKSISCALKNRHNRFAHPGNNGSDKSRPDHYADGMDLSSPLTESPALTDWKIISDTLARVVSELTMLTTQFKSMNDRITKLETTMTAPSPPSGPFIAKSPSYIPSINPNNNILINVNFPLYNQQECAIMIDNNKHNFFPHSSPLINFGQINVNGLVSPVQQHLLNFFLHSSFGVLSLNDTCLSSSGAKFIFIKINIIYIILGPIGPVPPLPILMMALEFYFAIPFINMFKRLYYPPSGSIHQNICKDLIAKFLSWLNHARSNNYHVVILGDFNIDEVAHSNYSYPTFYHANGSSRLDYIWSSPGFPAPGLFTQVVTCPPLLDRPFTKSNGMSLPPKWMIPSKNI
ncbi:unnamed protein product [Rhizophagus irregularis]|nr:unnamed protein product [Rhizophagus irregularis]